MNKWIILSVITILLSSLCCQKDGSNGMTDCVNLPRCDGGMADSMNLQTCYGEITDGLNIQIGTDYIINHNEIEYYDFSTHSIYLKHDCYLPGDSILTFNVIANREEIYSGIIYPTFSSKAFPGPVIRVSPGIYCNDMICLSFNGVYDILGNSNPDPRNDARIISTLKKYGQYHEGLKGIIDTVTVKKRRGDKSKIELIFTIVNEDNLNYYILDPDKMGTGLFHYFTNGLYLHDIDSLSHLYSYKGERISPSPWDLQCKNWLNLLEHGKSITFCMILNEFDNVPSGQYKATFMYPGFRRICKEDRDQEHGRIWMGNIRISKNVTVK